MSRLDRSRSPRHTLPTACQKLLSVIADSQNVTTDDVDRLAGPVTDELRAARESLANAIGNVDILLNLLEAAVGEFTKAQNIDPGRGEARATLVALTPTSMPVPALPSANKPLPQFIGAVLDDVDDFWSEYFDKRGARYPPAARHWYQTRIPTPCGMAIPGEVGPFYCTRDAGLYLDTNFIQDVRKTAGDFPVAYVVAHEDARHVQDLLGITKTNPTSCLDRASVS
jgi:predicted metalloprotease